MASRAVADACSTGRGACGKGAPRCGFAQIRQDAISARRRSRIKGAPPSAKVAHAFAGCGGPSPARLAGASARLTAGVDVARAGAGGRANAIAVRDWNRTRLPGMFAELKKTASERRIVGVARPAVAGRRMPAAVQIRRADSFSRNIFHAGGDLLRAGGRLPGLAGAIAGCEQQSQSGQKRERAQEGLHPSILRLLAAERDRRLAPAAGLVNKRSRSV